MFNLSNKLIVNYFKKYFNLKFLVKLQTKFSKFGDLVQWEQKIRMERVIVHPFPGSGSPGSTKAAKLSRRARAWKKLPNIWDFAIKVRPY